MVIRWNGESFRVLVSRTKVDRMKETYEIVGRNKTIYVESNRPFLLHKGLKGWTPTYKIQGQRINATGFEKRLLETLHEHIERNDNFRDNNLRKV